MRTADADGVPVPVRSRSLVVGRFRWDVLHDQLTGTPELYGIHGFDRTGLAPTRRQVLDRVHPDDLSRVRAVVEQVVSRAGLFGIAYRVRRLDDDRQREVVVTGEGLRDDEGRVFLLPGYLTDVSDDHRAGVRRAADEAVEAAVAGRGLIEQAKGVLSVAYGLGPDEAMSLLRSWSSRRNVKLRLIAERLVAEVRHGTVSSPTLRTQVDRMLDVATRRVED